MHPCRRYLLPICPLSCGPLPKLHSLGICAAPSRLCTACSPLLSLTIPLSAMRAPSFNAWPVLLSFKLLASRPEPPASHLHVRAFTALPQNEPHCPAASTHLCVPLLHTASHTPHAGFALRPADHHPLGGFRSSPNHEEKHTGVFCTACIPRYLHCPCILLVPVRSSACLIHESREMIFARLIQNPLVIEWTSNSAPPMQGDAPLPNRLAFRPGCRTRLPASPAELSCARPTPQRCWCGTVVS